MHQETVGVNVETQVEIGTRQHEKKCRASLAGYTGYKLAASFI